MAGAMQKYRFHQQWILIHNSGFPQKRIGLIDRIAKCNAFRGLR